MVTALAGFFFGSKELADEAARILLEAGKEVAAPIALDITGCSPMPRRRADPRRAVRALLSPPAGAEGLSIGLNRAYDAVEDDGLVAFCGLIYRSSLCAGRRGGDPRPSLSWGGFRAPYLEQTR